MGFADLSEVTPDETVFSDAKLRAMQCNAMQSQEMLRAVMTTCR